MSANDYLLINKKTFVVRHLDADTNQEWGKAIKSKSLLEAIETAQDIEEKEGVEYGIHFED